MIRSLDEKQKMIILNAGVDEWDNVVGLLPDGYQKSNANTLRRNAGLQSFLSQKNKKIYTYEENYFSEKSLGACYWAGFIAADGCVYKPTKGELALSVQIHADDQEHLKDFAKTLGGRTYPIRKRFDKRTGNTYSSISTTIHNNLIVKSLEETFNIHPRKSLTHEPPIGLSRDQNLAFIAGYIDGDGSYSSYASGSTTRRPRISICGTYDFLTWIINQLGVHANIHKNGKIHSVDIRGDFAIRARERYIKLDLPFMQRKYRRWERMGIDLEIKKHEE